MRRCSLFLPWKPVSGKMLQDARCTETISLIRHTSKPLGTVHFGHSIRQPFLTFVGWNWKITRLVSKSLVNSNKPTMDAQQSVQEQTQTRHAPLTSHLTTTPATLTGHLTTTPAPAPLDGHLTTNTTVSCTYLSFLIWTISHEIPAARNVLFYYNMQIGTSTGNRETSAGDEISIWHNMSCKLKMNLQLFEQ